MQENTYNAAEVQHPSETGKNGKNRRIVGIAVVITTILLMVLSGCGKDSGGPKSIASGRSAAIDDVKYSFLSEDYEAAEAENGYKVIKCEIGIENLTSSVLYLVGPDCYADSKNCDMSNEDEWETPKMDLVHGGAKDKMTVFFEVPEEAEHIELRLITSRGFSEGDKTVAFTVK